MAEIDPAADLHQTAQAPHRISALLRRLAESAIDLAECNPVQALGADQATLAADGVEWPGERTEARPGERWVSFLSAMTSKPDTDLELVLTGVVSRCIYQSPDQFYTVAEVEPRGDSRALVVAGNLGGCEEGDTVEVRGVWAEHPRFGRRLQVRAARWVPPVTVAGMKRFLAGGSVPGIGPRLAERIVDHFQDDTVRVLDEEPARLAEVDGIGAGRAEALSSAWSGCRARMEEQAFLAGLGLGPTLTRRMQEVAEVVRAAPAGIYEQQALAILRGQRFEPDAPGTPGTRRIEIIDFDIERAPDAE